MKNLSERLDEFYPGDGVWKGFARVFRGELDKDSLVGAELVRLVGGDEELAAVIYGSVFEKALEWVREKIPALNDRTMLEC